MKRFLTAIAISAITTVAMAQTTSTPTVENSTNNAISPSSDNNTAQPAAGANSFTEEQARSRIEAKGYTSVSNLSKDPRGVWRGKGMKGGASRDVALDYQGNVFGK